MTMHTSDVDAFTTRKECLFLWMPDMSKVFDMEGLKKRQDERRAVASKALVHHFKALFVRLVWRRVDKKSNAVHELKRQMFEHYMLSKTIKNKRGGRRKREITYMASEYDDLTRGILRV